MSQMSVQRRYCNSGYNQSSMYQDLIQAKTYLEKLRAEQPKVALHFSLWREHRKLTIETVDSLQKKLDALCVGCNIARGVGAAAGIVGVFAGLIGAVLEANEHESASNFKQASKYCAGAGAAAIVTSTLLEAGLSQSAINEIKRVLQKDIELTKPLTNWIKFSHEIDNRFKHIFQCNIASNTFHSAVKVYRQCIKLLDSGNCTVLDLIRNLQFGKMEGIEDLTMEIAEKVICFLKGMLTNPELFQPLKEIWAILEDNPHTFQLAKLGAIIYFKTNGLLPTEPLSVLLSAVGLSLPKFGTLATRCAFDAITLAYNVVTLILSVKNIEEGQSSYSKALDKVMFALRSELSEVDKQMNARVLSLSNSSGASKTRAQRVPYV